MSAALRLATGLTTIFAAAVLPAGESVELDLRAVDVVAAEVDRLIDSARPDGTQLPSLVGDEDFLRRVSIDLTGRIPSPRDVTLFGLDIDPHKRSKLVAELLESEDYARNWAAYWRDVIFLRATEQRARIVQPVFEQWMTEQFQANAPWDEIVTELLTAEGSVSDDGQVGLIFAHTGQPAELAAETSRIFLGIQIQCANCHNHPTDTWTREQFHQLAAFFPRIQVRPETPGEIRTFAVTTVDPGPRQGRGQFPDDPAAAFRRLDRNGDQRLTKFEARQAGPLGQRFDQLLAGNDKDGDGAFSLEEFKSLRRPNVNPQPGAASAEYYMPDLNDPASRGTLTTPVFFVNGNSLELGASGAERRDALADFMTAKDNPWFAKALVNRIWCELTGSGFYMPVDDLGPTREAEHAEALDLLATAFTANDYDIRWLLTTVVSTETYQRQISAGDEPSPAVVTPTRLRADQVYNSLAEVLGPEPSFGGPGRGPQGGGARFSPRGQFNELFGYDPSTPQDEITGNVPQALYLMNSPRVNNAIRSTGNTRLARILEQFSDDTDAVSEVYLAVLSREPADREVKIALRYVESVGRRGEAFEDLMWSLLNSAEFLSKR